MSRFYIHLKWFYKKEKYDKAEGFQRNKSKKW